MLKGKKENLPKMDIFPSKLEIYTQIFILESVFWVTQHNLINHTCSLYNI